MPSRLITELSNLRMAVFMASGFGKAVRPMLIALDRFVSKMVISRLAPSCLYSTKALSLLLQNKTQENFFTAKIRKQYRISQRQYSNIQAHADS